jgi:hypothetical protein
MSEFYEYNVEHYNIRNKYFWQLFFDRLAAYSRFPHVAAVNSVKLHPCGKLELTTSNNSEMSKLLRSRFVVLEEGQKLTIPSSIKSTKGISKGLWLFIPYLFDPKENSLIIESYIKFFYEKSYPKQFTTWFFKYLNKIIDLNDIIRKAGVQKIEFLETGILFSWPIYYLSKEAPEILNTSAHGITFSRNEVEKFETILVPYDFAWAALSGTFWSGNLKSLFHNVEMFKHIKDTLEENDTDRFDYCLERIIQNINTSGVS